MVLSHSKLGKYIMIKPANTSLIKSPNTKETFTNEQLVEFAKCFDPVTGPMYFMENYFYIQHPVKGKIKYQPYDYQRRLLDNYVSSRFSVSLLPRQSGKCVESMTYVRLRQKSTNKKFDIPIGIYYEYIVGKQNGTILPDITIYEVN